MKAYQIWMVARDPATLQELARALLDERDDRLECEAYNEALTVADKINLARSHFGRAVQARQPLYVVLVLVLPRPDDADELIRRLKAREAGRPVLTPEGRTHLTAALSQLCQCSIGMGPGGGRCPSCGRIKR
jgi:DNA-binding response OmpR family regulator